MFSVDCGFLCVDGNPEREATPTEIHRYREDPNGFESVPQPPTVANCGDPTVDIVGLFERRTLGESGPNERGTTYRLLYASPGYEVAGSAVRFRQRTGWLVSYETRDGIRGSTTYRSESEAREVYERYTSEPSPETRKWFFPRS